MTSHQGGGKLRSLRYVIGSAAAVVMLFGCAGSGTKPMASGDKASGQGQASEAAASGGDADKFLIVDCLLPPQVKKLGTSLTFLAPRRPVKTSAADCAIRGGEYVSYDRADYKTALKVWMPQAESGDAEAQNYVGQIYEQGLGVPPDYAKAALWYRKAADQGYSRAQVNLANLYEKGLGVKHDPTEALNLYRKAAGIKDDRLMYASAVVESKSSQAELHKLRGEVEKARQRAENYRRQLQDVRKQLAAKEDQVKKLKVDQQDKQQLLTLLQQQAPSAKRDDSIQRLNKELAGYKDQLSESKRQLAQLQQQADKYHSGIQHSVTTIASAEKAKPPQIEVIDPPINATRGVPRADLAPASKSKEIVGKVDAPAGVKRFTVNGSIQPIDQFNLFWATVTLTGDVTPVKLAILDRKDREVKYEFLIHSPRGTVTAATPPLSADGLQLGKFYALIIGNDDYKNLPTLTTPVNDARAVDKVLRERYGYKTRLLINATRYGILSALNDLRKTLTPQDNLLIYYAGHGEIDPVNSRGYWLPVDAELDNPAGWISNAAVTDMISAMQAMHIMVVADSCYSGTLTGVTLPRYSAALPVAEQKEWLQTIMGLRARTVLTSGGVEPVLDTGAGGDHSIFAQAFLEALKNNKRLLEGYTLYRDVLKEVSSSAAALNEHQTPEYAPIMHAGHEAGEFFFQPT